MALTKPTGTWTYGDLFPLPDDGRRYEIIEGELYEMPASNLAHATAIMNCIAPLLQSCRLWVDACSRRRWTSSSRAPIPSNRTSSSSFPAGTGCWRSAARKARPISCSKSSAPLIVAMTC